ncbi:hypothetical protein G7054_g1179 [Neopestalotiopsis clavispora]|nr:hypothetical protein G7054_g1179 [Neopestalotiopsis clavispora]
MSSGQMNVKGGALQDTGPGSGPAILGVNWTFTALAIIVVCLRMYVRKRIGYELDDWLMLVALAMMIVYVATITVSVQWGMGRKYASITLEEYKNIAYWQLLGQFWVNLQPVFSRWAIAVFLIRIFGKARPWFRNFLIFWVALMAIGAILANVLTLTLIDPIQANWDPTITTAHYRFKPIIEYYIAVGVGWQAAISDLAFAIIPVIFVWNLQLPTRKKLALIALLSGSLIAFLATLSKIIFSTMQIRGETGKTDGPTSGGILWITSGIEQGLVIILGSVPALGPLASLAAFSTLVDSLMYLVTFGRRSRRSSNASSMVHEEVELGQPKRISDDDRHSGGAAQQPVAHFADGSLQTMDENTAKYIRRTDDFVVVSKQP